MKRLVPLLTLAMVAVVAPAPVSAMDDTAGAIEARLRVENPMPNDPRLAAIVAGLRKFYAEREYRPAWLDRQRRGSRAGEALAVLSKASHDGLDPDDYGARQIAARMTPRTPDERAGLDLMLSLALSRYGADLHSGRVAAGDSRPDADGVDPKPGAYELLGAAREAADLSTYFANLAPRSPRYRRLRGALLAYRGIAANGGWPSVPAGPTLRLGATGERVAALHRRLAATGDHPDPLQGRANFDSELEAAVRRFQRRHGLTADGVVGPRTRAALNVPVEQRLAQIRLNLERRRWMPADLGERHIFVNTADFVLKAVEAKKTVLDMRVVVGTAYRRTPVFSAPMTYLEFHPYWNIPTTIARLEIAPEARKNLSYLSERSIKVFADWSAAATELSPHEVNWVGADNGRFPYRLRQDPGPRNPLGRVKFMLPNSFDVYLHDTPARGLFDHDIRAFSHGCIRVEKPAELATYLLETHNRWSQGDVREAMDAGKTSRVVLAKPIPVHIAYLTAWVNKDGSVHFRRDIYDRDRMLGIRLQKSAKLVSTGFDDDSADSPKQ